MDKQIMANPYNEKERTTDRVNMNESQKYLWKSDTKERNTVWYHVYETLKRTNKIYNDKKKIRGCQGSR